jgi:hypothetical protein
MRKLLLQAITLLTLNCLLIVAASAGPPGAYVVDSKGKIVGPYSPLASGGAGALVSINGIWFELPVLTTGFAPVGATVDYSGQNCSGTAYMEVLPDQLVVSGVGSVGFGIDQTGVLYYPIPGPSSDQVTFCSQLNVGQGCFNERSCAGIGLLDSQASTFDLSTLGFVPPFQLQSKP